MWPLLLQIYCLFFILLGPIPPLIGLSLRHLLPIAAPRAHGLVRVKIVSRPREERERGLMAASVELLLLLPLSSSKLGFISPPAEGRDRVKKHKANFLRMRKAADKITPALG